MTEQFSSEKRAKTGPLKRRKARSYPKGRQVSEAALAEIKALIGESPYQRDLLIEYFHLIQDQYGHISAAHLHALASLLKIGQAEAYEVADFYAHFDVVKDGEAPPAPITIRVCSSLSCALEGAEELIGALKADVDPSQIRILPAPCMGRCADAPVAEVGHLHVDKAKLSTLLEVVQSGHFKPTIPPYTDFEAYKAQGGYRLLESCLSGGRDLQEVIDCLSESGLRGLGGAGFPAGQKWSIVRSYKAPRLMTINGDEGEPGTFKDRYYLEKDPHRMIEGALIAAWAVEAERCYIYMRDEYPAVLKILAKEIEAVNESVYGRQCTLELRRGAGAYICGEESAMIESIEGKRGLPRHRPPYIAEVGVFGRPTLNHNVETLYWVRDILEKGAAWFADQGVGEAKGLRSFSVSGRVKNPGVVLAPAGLTIMDLIEKCGGMAEGHSFKAYLPGGASGGILPASMNDIPLDFGTLERHGCFIGSHAIIILSEQDHMRDVALNLLRFFADESCGQCTPCRVGCEKSVDLMSQPRWDEDLLNELSQAMSDASICGLGQAAPNPIQSVLNHFRPEVSGKT